MSSFCVFVKPTARRPNSTFVSLQRSGPVWKGAQLRLERPDELGLRFPVLIGWSDFYGGTPAPVSVAWASDGERTGWVAWGGSQGLRAVPEGDDAAGDAVAPATFEERPLLWIDDLRCLPAEVAAIVARGEVRARQGAEPRQAAAPRAAVEGRTGGDGRDGTPSGDVRPVPPSQT